MTVKNRKEESNEEREKPREELREDLFFLKDDLARTHADLGQQVVQLGQLVQTTGQRLEKHVLEREAVAAREREAATLERAADKQAHSQALAAIEGRLAAAEAGLRESRGEREATRREFSKTIHDFGSADRALVEKGLLVMERRSAEQLERLLKTLDARDQQLRSEVRDWLASLRQEVSAAGSQYMKHPEFENSVRRFAQTGEVQPRLEEAAARLAGLEKGVDKIQTGFEEKAGAIFAQNLRVLEAELRTFVKELDRDRLDDARSQLARLEGRVTAIEGPRPARSPGEAKLEATAARRVAIKAVAEAVGPLQEQLEQLRRRLETLQAGRKDEEQK